ncbi:TonB-dependent receptor [Sphingosinicella rhizophila]|uniref:TonB-dependent receptor n=1 Tax=Sphingosinicella rhizophila TaxID=3050082 RepID=A0ABU3QC86_9SPHN|nr:TonB-dependent receptor [Sphingosinicella sp. GR2756]MDT9601012.1 TonB-dependent receptor [Sphingosinicella sp. GR2756]
MDHRKILAFTTSLIAIGTASVAKASDTAAAAQPVEATQTGSASSGDEGLANNEIVVTGSKRDQRLQDLPSAATVISNETIVTAGIQDFRDYASLVPGLSQRDFGTPGLGTVVIRGLNTGPQQTSNTAAYYLDDAPVTASGPFAIGSFFTPSPDLGDVERIEVLKGPQGTLFGANSLGGLVRVISRSPDLDDFAGNVRAEISDTYSGDVGYSARGVVNIPLAQGKAAIRASGSFRHIGGFADNVGTGTKNANESDIYGGRLALRFQPIDNLTIDAVAFLQNIEATGGAGTDHITGTLTPEYGKYKYNAFADLPSNIKYRLFSGSVDYDFGPISWITTVSYGDLETNILADYTEIYLPFVAGFVPPDTLVRGNVSPSTEKWTAESRLVSERLGAFEFILGGYYTKEKSFYRTVVNLLNPTTMQLLPGIFGDLLRTGTSDEYEEIAGFGNLTFYLTDSLDVTGGIRLIHLKDVSTGGLPVDGIAASSFFVPRAPSTFSNSENPITYLATLRWRPTDRISTYLRAASGYRPGGPQVGANLPPDAQTEILSDTTWNYEAGIRGSFLGNKLAIEASVYRIDWDDIQLSTLSGGFVLRGNGGSGKVDGFELAATARPTRFLTISGSLGYTNARLTQIDPAASVVLGAVAGDKLPLTPEFTASLLADHRIPLSTSTDATIGGTLRYQSDMPSGFPGDPLNPNINIPGYATVDLRGGVDFGRFSLQLRADNIFNKLGYTTVTTNKVIASIPVSTVGTTIRPRTFTLSLSADF